MATLYWYGGTGSWNAATGHWSLNSGNSPAADHAAPTAADDVVFDTLSNATAYTVTITSSSVCKSCTVGNPLAGVITWTSGGDLTVSGSLTMATGMTNSWTGNCTFNATSGTQVITSNGVAFATRFSFSGSGGTFQLADNLATTANTFTLSGSAIFDANSKTVTLTGNTATTTISGAFSGSSSFYNLTLLGANNKTGAFTFTANPTISNVFTITGNSTTNRILLASQLVGTTLTITAASVSADKADFRDITGAGAASWDMSAAAGYTGNCGGNSMKALGTAAFTPAVTTNWSSGATWSTATWSSRVPLPQDTATFTTAGVQTITQDMPRIGSVDFSTSTNKTWTTSTAAECYGSIDLTGLAAFTASTQAYTFRGRGNFTLKSAGFTWSKNITYEAPGGTLTLKDNLVDNNAADVLAIFQGNFDAADSGANHTVTYGKLLANGSLVRTITKGTGLWKFTGTGANVFLLVATNLTWSDSGGTTEMSGAAPDFTSAGISLGTVNFTNATPAITTFSNFLAAACTITGAGTMTLSGGATWNVTSLTANTSTVIFATTGSPTITSHAQSFYNLTINKSAGTTASLSSDLSVSNVLTLTQGTFDANGFNVTAKNYVGSGASTRVLTMGSGTWTLTGTGTVFDHSTVTGLTVTATTSTIIINETSATSKTFDGGGKTYGNITYSGKNIINLGANTFATIALNNNGDTDGITFPASTTTTCTGFTSTGSLGNLAKMISSSAGTAATISKTTGTVTVNYVSIKDSTATGGATFNAVNCTNVSGNTGWNFSGAAAVVPVADVASPFFYLS